MRTAQIHFKNTNWSAKDFSSFQELKPQLVFAFGSPTFFKDDQLGAKLRGALPNSEFIGCSTAGEISNDGVFDKSLVLTGVRFEKNGEFRGITVPFDSADGGYSTGVAIGKELNRSDLTCVFVLGQGVNINGSSLIEGIVKNVKEGVIITGGLAGDDGAFEKTFVLHNEKVGSQSIAAVAFYGDAFKISYGSMGGWQPFGPVRKVTKVQSNILLELDGEPALQVYKKYLGEKAKGLPAAGLLYPFAVLDNNQSTTGIIRTILGVDEAQGSLTLAGDLEEGRLVRLMHSQTADLVSGAEGAAQKANEMLAPHSGSVLALLISCVGRKLVMGDDTDEEIEAVQSVLGPNSVATGFYSYGEICPFQGLMNCKLHNQTMTITLLSE